ncbi:hypothetical protein HDU97_006675 [Phlyctochytrium planicorne]|nr:hypothetical protein HDU97_006675 [Phlyctochytrium planicorne]
MTNLSSGAEKEGIGASASTTSSSLRPPSTSTSTMLKHSSSQISIANNSQVWFRSKLFSAFIVFVDTRHPPSFLPLPKNTLALSTNQNNLKKFASSSSKPSPKPVPALANISASLVPSHKKPHHQRKHNTAKQPHPYFVEIRPSLCKEFTVVAEEYAVHLFDGTGCIPMDRRCTTAIYGHAVKARGAVLLIPGFASNRAVFDMGGGKGRDGPSFFEYLARRGYDTFSIDLRGSREAVRLGSRPPAFLKEHVEVDVPSAIRFIKSIGKYDKVYLIGHSMGGAISCAVAGHVPDEVAGIVHLAGLYHYTIPYVNDFLSLYRARCPKIVQNAITTGAGLALRSAVSILSPAISSLLHFLSPPSTLCIEGPTQDLVSTGPQDVASSGQLLPVEPSGSLSSLSRSLFVELRRKHIPLRSAVDFCLFLKKFIPSPIERMLMNCMYPSPWLPYSVDDPWSLVNLSCESPTVGIWLAINKMAVQDDVYNSWVIESSTHRAEVQQIEESREEYKDKNDKPLKSLSALNDSAGGHAGLKHIVSQSNASSTNGHLKLKQALHPVCEPMTKMDESLQKKNGTPGPASREGLSKSVPNLVGGSSDAVAATANGNSAHATAAPKPVGEPTTSTTSGTVKVIETNPSWNELAPYLERFEQLEHLPLFFCHANADAILRTEDTMAGYRRSGSKWKEVIEYEDGKKVVKGVETGGAAAVGSGGGGGGGGGGGVSDGAKVPNGSSGAVAASPEPVVHPRSLGKNGKRRLAASIRLTPLKDDSGVNLAEGGTGTASPSSGNRSRRSSNAPSNPVSPRLNGSKMSSVASSVEDLTLLAASIVESPASVTALEEAVMESAAVSSSAPAKTRPATTTAATAPRPKPNGNVRTGGKPGIKPRYAVPESFSYGHCDILGGRHAEKVWERIADWLDATSAREREWRFKRRYSAK